VGLAIGLVEAKGARVVTYGHVRHGSDAPVTGDSVFEVGSITKVFTCLLLARMVETGEVGLHDPIAKYVPAWVKSARAREVTLLHLSRHTGGFPLWPDNMRPVDPSNPADTYTNEMLFAFLDAYRTGHEAGTFHLYSNYGMALLGELLARRAATDYHTALRQRVLEPLGMGSTTTLPTRGMPAAGSMRSTASDMVRFIEANLGFGPSPLARAMRATHETHADRQMPDLAMGLGWQHATHLGERLVVHGGATDDFTAYLALDLVRNRGVVVLSNGDDNLENVAIHLLVPSVPLYQPDPPEK
jgi:CubicO group peptidase (beta-lactamase class C family)